MLSSWRGVSLLSSVTCDEDEGGNGGEAARSANGRRRRRRRRKSALSAMEENLGMSAGATTQGRPQRARQS